MSEPNVSVPDVSRSLLGGGAVLVLGVVAAWGELAVVPPLLLLGPPQAGLKMTLPAIRLASRVGTNWFPSVAQVERHCRLIRVVRRPPVPAPGRRLDQTLTATYLSSRTSLMPSVPPS